MEDNNCSCNSPSTRNYISKTIQLYMKSINDLDGTQEAWLNAKEIIEKINLYKKAPEYSKLVAKEKEEINLLERACQNVIDENLNWE